MRRGDRVAALSTPPARRCSYSPSSGEASSSPVSFLKHREATDVEEPFSPTSTPESHKFPRKRAPTLSTPPARRCSYSPSSGEPSSSPVSFLKHREATDVEEPLSPTSTPDSHKFPRKRAPMPSTPESLKFPRKRKTCPVVSSSDDEVCTPSFGRGKARKRQRQTGSSRSTVGANSRRRRRQLLPESPPSSSSVRSVLASSAPSSELDSAVKVLTGRHERRVSLSGKKQRAPRSGAKPRSCALDSPLESFDDDGVDQSSQARREMAKKITKAELVLQRRDRVKRCTSKHCNGTLLHALSYSHDSIVLEMPRIRVFEGT